MQIFYWLLGIGGMSAGAGIMALFNSYILDPIKINAAVKAATAVQVQLCDKRIADNANEINAHNDALVDVAEDARDSTGLTPVDQAELQDLCNGEAECRDAQSADPKKVTP